MAPGVSLNTGYAVCSPAGFICVRCGWIHHDEGAWQSDAFFLSGCVFGCIIPWTGMNSYRNSGQKLYFPIHAMALTGCWLLQRVQKPNESRAGKAPPPAGSSGKPMPFSSSVPGRYMGTHRPGISHCHIPERSLNMASLLSDRSRAFILPHSSRQSQHARTIRSPYRFRSTPHAPR